MTWNKTEVIYTLCVCGLAVLLVTVIVNWNW